MSPAGGRPGEAWRGEGPQWDSLTVPCGRTMTGQLGTAAGHLCALGAGDGARGLGPLP